MIRASYLRAPPTAVQVHRPDIQAGPNGVIDKRDLSTISGENRITLVRIGATGDIYWPGAVRVHDPDV